MTGIAVLVDSRGGNTRKVADAIAEELGVPAGNVPASIPNDATILFLGTGTYGGKPGESLQKFIGSGDFTGRTVAVFGTSGGAGSADKMLAEMTDTLKQKGATVLGSFHCRGKTFIVNWGHPDKQDLDNAKKFAREMLNAAP